MSKKIREKCWWVHIRPVDQPSARLASVYIQDGGMSDNPEMLGKLFGDAIRDAMSSGIETYGTIFKKYVRQGKIRVEVILDRVDRERGR